MAKLALSSSICEWFLGGGKNTTLGFRFRLDNERFRFWKGSDRALIRREVRSLRPPYFLETISCPPVIMGETGDSGHRPGWDRTGKMTTFPNEFRESYWRVTRFKIRAENGRIQIRIMLGNEAAHVQPWLDETPATDTNTHTLLSQDPTCNRRMVPEHQT